MPTFHDLASGQRGYISREQLLGIGMTDEEIEHLVEREHWQRPQRGVYLTGSAPADWTGNVRAGCLAAAGDVKAMGRTAARLRGLDGADRHTIIELSVGVLRGPAPRGVIVRRTRRHDPSLTTTIDGIPVSSINELLREYAWLVRPDVPVERAVEDALRRGYTSEGALRRFLAGCGKGVPGVTHLRNILDARPEGRPARSGFEVIVLDIIREYGLAMPQRRPLVDAPPDQMFELDLAYLDRKVDIEAMGAKWHTTTTQRREDEYRRRVLSSMGWLIVEVGWDEAIHTPWLVADRIRAAFCA
jgi:hypothetical protein